MKLIISGLLIGFLVSLIEAACTGQVYVPVLGILAKSGDARAWLYLLLYNVLFIFPLVLILALGLWGVSSTRLQEFFKSHLGWIKLGMAALFFVISGVLLF